MTDSPASPNGSQSGHPQLLTIAQAAERTGRTRKAIEHLVQRGQIPTRRDTQGRHMIHPSSLDSLGLGVPTQEGVGKEIVKWEQRFLDEVDAHRATAAAAVDRERELVGRDASSRPRPPSSTRNWQRSTPRSLRPECSAYAACAAQLRTCSTTRQLRPPSGDRSPAGADRRGLDGLTLRRLGGGVQRCADFGPDSAVLGPLPLVRRGALGAPGGALAGVGASARSAEATDDQAPPARRSQRTSRRPGRPRRSVRRLG